MKIEQVRPTIFRVTLHAYELAALVAAARWAVNGAQGAFPEEAREHLQQVLASYEAEAKRLGRA